MPPSARVFILYTGGTIGMAPSDPRNPASPLAPMPLADLLHFVPALGESTSRFQLEYESLDHPLDSSNVGPAQWLDIAHRIERVYDRFDGFVILHGTDTLAYTASALAFLFENLAKPVVLTGSQVPISGVRTDGIMNFVNAVHVAGYVAANLPCIPEVVVVFADRILRGCRARKVSTKSWAGFDSPNLPPLGRIGESIRIDTRLLRPTPPPGAGFRVAPAGLNTRVVDLGITPGLDPHLLEHLLAARDVDGIVIRTYGAGNAPAALWDAIGEASRRHKTIVNVTQCLEGTVEMGLYAASAGLLERGVISGLDMTPEAALAKLMWSLAADETDVAHAMQTNQRGEQSHNLHELAFGAAGSRTEPVPRYNGIASLVGATPLPLTRAVVRFSRLGVTAATRLRVLLADRALAECNVEWKGSPESLVVELDESLTARLLAEAETEVSLSVVSASGDASFWFAGLYLTLFSESRN